MTSAGRMTARVRVWLARSRVAAVVLDMDGVLTDTARVHQAAWKRLFDEVLRARAAAGSAEFREFTEVDYLRHVDGVRREDGIAAFLSSRGITLPWGDPHDGPEAETVVGLGLRKNGYFLDALAEHGVRVYPGTVALVDQLRAAGVGVAVVTASRNAVAVLGRAGLDERFPVRVDGEVAARLGLPGKPDPAIFVEAARRLGFQPQRCVVVEDAVAGVRAGRAGGFELVIGVDRSAPNAADRAHRSQHADDLLAAGADVVVTDLAEVAVEGPDEHVGPDQSVTAERRAEPDSS